MKYKEIYKALERRWQVSPGFRFVDYSGWRNPSNSNASYRPLWIIVEDKLGKRCIWITQSGTAMAINWQRMDENGHGIGESVRIRCKNKTEMAQKLEQLFAETSMAA